MTLPEHPDLPSPQGADPSSRHHLDVDPDIDPNSRHHLDVDLDAALLHWQELEDPPAGSRWSTWSSVEPLSRGPRPWPAWLVTDEALDTELGVLKTGKEADVFLLERSSVNDPSRSVLMAAKRYRGEEHRDFHRAADYTAGRSVRNSRDMRALSKKTSHGRAVAAGQWAWAEWTHLSRFHAAGLPVPYPVQIDGTEILMELVCDSSGAPAPRLAAAALARDRRVLTGWFEQVADALRLLGSLGYAHGDLSAYNILAADERAVVIDLPQAVDLAGNPHGMEFLHRDCVNICTWFGHKGLDVDPEALFAEVLADAF